MGSISYHITPVVINSFEGGHTHTHTDIACIQTFVDRSNSKKPGACRPDTPGLKSLIVSILSERFIYSKRLGIIINKEFPERIIGSIAITVISDSSL